MRTRSVWLLTAVMIVGSSALTAARGWEIVRFERAVARHDSLQSWFDVSGVSFLARENALTVVDDLSDTQRDLQRREDIDGILSVRPMSADYWVSLAKMRQATGLEPNEVLEALEFSSLTGPDEGVVILHRGLFGIWQWQTLPPDLQAQTATDLTASRLSNNDEAWLKADLAGKPDAVRQEIRTALLAQGLPASELSRIGL